MISALSMMVASATTLADFNEVQAVVVVAVPSQQQHVDTVISKLTADFVLPNNAGPQTLAEAQELIPSDQYETVFKDGTLVLIHKGLPSLVTTRAQRDILQYLAGLADPEAFSYDAAPAEVKKALDAFIAQKVPYQFSASGSTLSARPVAHYSVTTPNGHEMPGTVYAPFTEGERDALAAKGPKINYDSTPATEAVTSYGNNRRHSVSIELRRQSPHRYEIERKAWLTGSEVLASLLAEADQGRAQAITAVYQKLAAKYPDQFGENVGAGVRDHSQTPEALRQRLSDLASEFPQRFGYDSADKASLGLAESRVNMQPGIALGVAFLNAQGKPTMVVDLLRP